MKQLNLSCRGMDEKLTELLLEADSGALAASAAVPDAVPDKIQAKARAHLEVHLGTHLGTHLDTCDRCRQELAELRATMTLLDAWEGPEPDPYFLSRLKARLREEREIEWAGWLRGGMARLRARLTYGTGTHLRPLAATALTIVLLVGGGAYLDVTNWEQPQLSAAPGQAAVVHDLQIMNNNAQLLDQLEELSSNNGD